MRRPGNTRWYPLVPDEHGSAGGDNHEHDAEAVLATPRLTPVPATGDNHVDHTAGDDDHKRTGDDHDSAGGRWDPSGRLPQRCHP